MARRDEFDDVMTSEPGAPAAPPGAIAPKDGGQPAAEPHRIVTPEGELAPIEMGQADLGPNNERLEELKPRLVQALRGLVSQFREEGIAARHQEIKRIRQARLFWQGLQYAWWNPGDLSWHLPFEARGDAAALEEMPRYQFVTNLYQAFGLSFIAVLSQDVPATRFYPQSAQSEQDIATAKAASEVAKLVEQNNRVPQLLTAIGFHLWTDGKVGGYVRYVTDGQRFGFREEPVIEPSVVKLGEDVFVCPGCGAEVPADGAPGFSPADAASSFVIPSGVPTQSGRSEESQPNAFATNAPESPDAATVGLDVEIPRPQTGLGMTGVGRGLLGMTEGEGGAAGACPACGAALGAENFKPAELALVPAIVATRRVPNGQEVITIAGGLELNTPVWANEVSEFPYLQWQTEVHAAKLKAAYPRAADKIESGGPAEADDIYARASRVAVAQGLPGTHPGDALTRLITFTRTWIRPWSFYAIEDKQVRAELLALFPDGCYAAFAGDTYCESRSESMDDHWRVLHALPGDGQNRPSVGDSLVQIQERYNTLSNIQAETYEFGIPPIYADPQVLDFDALASQTAEPAAHYPARARPGQPLEAGFFQPRPAQVPPDMLRHQQELAGPIAQFLTGLFPAVFGGESETQKTATGYALQRDQALGRLGLVWRRLKQFYAELMLLAVDTFRKNRPEDAEIPFLGAGGEFQSRWIRLADLKGNIQAYAEPDESFPRLKSQQRAVLQQLMGSSDPVIQQALGEPANLGFIKNLIGLNEMVVPGEDSRNKQLREIQQLLAAAPIVVAAPSVAASPATLSFPTHPTRMGEESQPNVFAANARESAEAFAQGPNAEIPRSSRQNPSGLPRNDTARAPSGMTGGVGEVLLPSVLIDELLDDHGVEYEECKRWANSDAGQVARAENPLGFANVRAHAALHLAALERRQRSAQP